MRTRRTTPRRRTRSEEEEIKEMEQMQEARSAREMQEEAGKTQAPCSRSRCRSDVCRAWAFSAEFCSARCARYDCMAYPTAPTSTVSMMATVSIDMVSESAAFVCSPRLGCDASPPAACPPACAAAPPKSRPRCARSPTSILILLRSPMLIPAVFSASIVSCASGPPPRRRSSTAVRRPRPSSNCPAAPVDSPGCRRTDSSASSTAWLVTNVCTRTAPEDLVSYTIPRSQPNFVLNTKCASWRLQVSAHGPVADAHHKCTTSENLILHF